MAQSWVLDGSIDVDGRDVRYGCRGEGSPVVLVHGTPWSSYNLRHLVAALAKHHRVYYFDLLGYGQSSKRDGDVSLHIQNRVLDRLLDHWGLDAPAVIGHDFGGATLLRTYLLNGRRFRKMVLIDPVAVAPWGSPFFEHVNAHEAAFAEVPAYIHEAIVRAYIKTAAYQPLDESVFDRIVEPWQGPEGQAAFYRQIAQADAIYTDEVQPRYSDIDCPVLILWGREDRWMPVVRGEVLQRLIPGSRLSIVDGAGHLVIEERPEALLADIEPFIR